MSGQHTPGRDHIGAGLAVEHGYTSPVRPQAFREGPNRFRAEISGCVNGAVVRAWASADVYPSHGEALAAAIAKATGGQA